MDKQSAEYKEARRLYALEYRKQNALKIKERHEWRLANDEDYARRYREKQERRRVKYEEAHAEATRRREQRRIDLAIARKENERVRNKKARESRSAFQRSKYNAEMKEYRSANTERINQQRRDRLKNDPEHAEKIRARDRLRSKTNGDRRLSTNMKSMYGITLEEYDAKYAAQNGTCEICGDVKPSRGKERLVIDHCHTNGNVRGLLCTPCNTGLGLFRDNVEFLRKAIEYLKRS